MTPSGGRRPASGARRPPRRSSTRRTKPNEAPAQDAGPEAGADGMVPASPRRRGSAPGALPGLSARDVSERRIAFVDARLPQGNRTAYVRSAFEAFLAPSCSAFLGGEVAEVCARSVCGPSAGRPFRPRSRAFRETGASPGSSTPTSVSIRLSRGVFSTACPTAFRRPRARSASFPFVAPQEADVLASAVRPRAGARAVGSAGSLPATSRRSKEVAMPTSSAPRPPVRATAEEAAEAFTELRKILVVQRRG